MLSRLRCVLRAQTMLLCNLTVSDDGCKELLQLGQEELEGLNV